jgi:bile acid:Na+ symporter, BASS family
MEELLPAAEIAIRLSVILFMVGNLLAIGLETDVRAALAPLRDVRFLVIVMVVDWLFAPALAVAIVRALPMAEPYAVGLLLTSLAPAAPFLPMMVRRAGGDLSYTAAFMLVAALGTVLMMPLGVPVIVPGLSVEAWAVARPLLVLLVLPLGIGMGLRAVHRRLAEKALRLVRPLATLATGALLLAVAIRYVQGFIGAVGSFAIAGQLVYAAGLIVGGYLLAIGLPPARRSVVSLGACTRNLGAALAPLLVTDPDPRTTVMVALGVPVTLGATWLASRWLGRLSASRRLREAS